MPDNINTGSFGAAIGDVGPLKNAMQRRGMDASILDQVSPSAAIGPTSVAGNVQGQIPMGGEAGATPGTLSQGTAEQVVSPVRSGEMEIALKALASVAKTESKIAEAAIGLR